MSKVLRDVQTMQLNQTSDRDRNNTRITREGIWKSFKCFHIFYSIEYTLFTRKKNNLKLSMFAVLNGVWVVRGCCAFSQHPPNVNVAERRRHEWMVSMVTPPQPWCVGGGGGRVAIEVQCLLWNVMLWMFLRGLVDGSEGTVVVLHCLKPNKIHKTFVHQRERESFCDLTCIIMNIKDSQYWKNCRETE